MKRILKLFLVAATILAFTAPLVMAQTQGSPAPSPAPSAPGVPPTVPSVPLERSIDGPVKNVDPAAKTIRVGWFLGLFSTTLEVNDDTQIAVGGTKASLVDIREGDRVKAAYEARQGKNIAKSIEVTQAEAQGGAGTSSGAPAPRPAQ